MAEAWVKNPLIYEINTWVWLDSLSRQHNQSFTLGSIPASVYDSLAQSGFHAVWLMGVWQRSPAGRGSALNYTDEYRAALPDLTDDDVIGSAYAIGAYEVDARLGGREALAAFRQNLAQRDIKLILDFVPNHVATDHSWVQQRPACFVRANQREFKQHRGLFFESHDTWGRKLFVAHGKDPYFPSWIDTAQLNAFSADYRRAAVETLFDIASQCDGVRCDMAMLMLNSVFANTWGDYVDEDIPQTDFWVEIIPQIKARHPHFQFMAEVYWGLEGTLLQQGFNSTYDKTLYDRIGEGDIIKIHDHLRAPLGYQNSTIRFTENHDEPRAASAYGVEKSMAAALLVCTLPGAKLLHDGQFEGRTVKLPVQIKRQPDEPPIDALTQFYERLLNEVCLPLYRDGEWLLLESRPLSEKDTSHAHLLAYSWQQSDHYRMITVNLTPSWARGVVALPEWTQIDSSDWCLHDVLDDTYYYRPGKQMRDNGLTVELKPYGMHLFRFEAIDESRALDYPCQLFTTH